MKPMTEKSVVVVIKKISRIYSYFSLITILALNFSEGSSERLILIPFLSSFSKAVISADPP